MVEVLTEELQGLGVLIWRSTSGLGVQLQGWSRAPRSVLFLVPAHRAGTVNFLEGHEPLPLLGLGG